MNTRFRDDENEGDSITRKIMKTDNFTHQTGILDVDKHMMAYIERELAKRRGQESGEIDTEKELQALDPRDELFKVAEKYKIYKKPVDEGNVTTSSAMLTAIPEIDLGIDNRLKNIEATEKAKRKLQEQRAKIAVSSAHSGQLDDYHDPNYAGSRCAYDLLDGDIKAAHFPFSVQSFVMSRAIRQTLTPYEQPRLRPV